VLPLKVRLRTLSVTYYPHPSVLPPKPGVCYTGRISAPAFRAGGNDGQILDRAERRATPRGAACLGRRPATGCRRVRGLWSSAHPLAAALGRVGVRHPWDVSSYADLSSGSRTAAPEPEHRVQLDPVGATPGFRAVRQVRILTLTAMGSESRFVPSMR